MSCFFHRGSQYPNTPILIIGITSYYPGGQNTRTRACVGEWRCWRWPRATPAAERYESVVLGLARGNINSEVGPYWRRRWRISLAISPARGQDGSINTVLYDIHHDLASFILSFFYLSGGPLLEDVTWFFVDNREKRKKCLRQLCGLECLRCTLLTLSDFLQHLRRVDALCPS